METHFRMRLTQLRMREFLWYSNCPKNGKFVCRLELLLVENEIKGPQWLMVENLSKPWEMQMAKTKFVQNK